MWWDFSRSWGDTVVANSILFFCILKKKQFPKYPGTCWTKQRKKSWRPGMLFMWGLCYWWRRILFREEFPKMTCGTSSCQAPLAHRTMWECLSVVFLKVPSWLGVGHGASNLFWALCLRRIPAGNRHSPWCSLGNLLFCEYMTPAFPGSLVGSRVNLEGAMRSSNIIAKAQSGYFFWCVSITGCLEKIPWL